MKNEETKKLIEENFSEWKKCLYKIHNNIINLFIINYDEEKIENILKGLITEKEYKSKYDSSDRYYALIYSLLNLKDEYAVVTENNFNENDDIRELLFTDKKY